MRIALVHPLRHSPPPIGAAFARAWPEAGVTVSVTIGAWRTRTSCDVVADRDDESVIVTLAV